MARELILGAVAYDPKVVAIWQGFKHWFAGEGLAMDYILYSNYERQVEALVGGGVDVAWNSPLAWVRARRLAPVEAVAMRDTDRDLTSVVIVGEGSGIASVADLSGRRVGVGAVDSPQATLIPLWHLAESGARDVEVVRHDIGVGMHGDHVGGERDAVRSLLAGRVDAACIVDVNHLAFSREGSLPAGATRVLTETPPFDHCNFTVVRRTAEIDRFTDLLLSMSFDDPGVRPLLEMEGLTAWLAGRTTGYGPLEAAVDASGFYGDDGAVTAPGYSP